MIRRKDESVNAGHGALRKTLRNGLTPQKSRCRNCGTTLDSSLSDILEPRL